MTIHLGSDPKDIALQRRLMKERNRVSGLGRGLEEVEFQRVSETTNWDPLYGELEPQSFNGAWVKVWAAIERDPESDETDAREEGRTKVKQGRIFIAYNELSDLGEDPPKRGDVLRFHGEIWEASSVEPNSIFGSENNALEWRVEYRQNHHWNADRRLAGA